MMILTEAREHSIAIKNGLWMAAERTIDRPAVITVLQLLSRGVDPILGASPHSVHPTLQAMPEMVGPR